MRRLVVLFLILLSAGLWAEYPEKIRLRGTTLDYQWAHGKQELSLLFRDNNGNCFIYLFNVNPFMIDKKFYIGDLYKPLQISWNHDDSLLIFTSRQNEYDDIFELDPETGDIDKYFKTEPRIGFVRDIQFSDKDLWSITWEVEGTIDIFFYCDGKLVNSTNTGPGYVESLGWQNGTLFARGNIVPESLFRGNKEKGGIILNNFTINPYTGETLPTDRYFRDVLNSSFDSGHYLNIIVDSYIDLFELWLY